MKVSIIHDSIHNLEEKLNELGSWSNIYIIADEHTVKHCFPLLIESQDIFKEAEIIELTPGEETKSMEMCYQIWGGLLEYKADRNILIVNLGGGVITDLGGFIASTFKRGVDFINIPTTLMGQVDAAIGGKTGINYEGLKNQIGTFSLPLFTWVDPVFLETLPEREFMSGMAEIIKYGAVFDSCMLDLLDKDWETNLSTLITRSSEIKAEVVKTDFTEKGDRKKLNFGHTIGHALETYFEGQLLHGEAVAAGMIVEIKLSVLYNELSIEKANKLITIIDFFFERLPLEERIFDELIELMKTDKKNINDKIHFVLLSNLGESKINCSLTSEQIKEGLVSYL